MHSKNSRIVLGLSLVLFLAGTNLYLYKSHYLPRDVNTSKIAANAITNPIVKNFDIIIPKLNISVPVVANVDGTNEAVYDKALEGGVAQFKGTALPGEKSNIFIFGHSSANIDGPYAKIFADLNDLSDTDEIKINYHGREYGYTVTSKNIVEATDISPLQKTNTEQLTLMTCWPIGTDQERLIVIAKLK